MLDAGLNLSSTAFCFTNFTMLVATYDPESAEWLWALAPARNTPSLSVTDALQWLACRLNIKKYSYSKR